jgi:putative NIF3 family GTP cyclohydrolase 1 type 2
VLRVAVCGGSGGDMINKAVSMDCDTYVTADVKHDQFMEALDLGINLIDGGHFPTENVVVPRIAEILKKGFPGLDIKISERCGQTEEYR